jgi:hypothetical protein
MSGRAIAPSRRRSGALPCDQILTFTEGWVAEPFWRLVRAVEAFLADEDYTMEQLLADGKRLEDFGFPFPRVIEIRSALAAIADAVRRS